MVSNIPVIVVASDRVHYLYRYISVLCTPYSVLCTALCLCACCTPRCCNIVLWQVNIL